MSLPAIPSGLIPLIAGYSFAGPDGVVATDVAGGMPRQALYWDRGQQKFNVSLVLKPAQFSAWNVFFLRIIKKGALSFTMDLNSGFGCAPHAVTIIPGSYNVTGLNMLHATVSFSVWAESQAYSMSDDDAVALIDIYEAFGEDVHDFLDRLAIFANSDLNVLNNVR